MVRIFYHQGNPVAVILKKRDKSIIPVFEKSDSADPDEKIRLLENAIEKDPNDVWLLVHLASTNLDQKNIGEFQKNLERGKKIHPFYEPLYLLEAQKYYSEGNYPGAMVVLDSLLGINPRYQPMETLLHAVKEKLN